MSGPKSPSTPSPAEGTPSSTGKPVAVASAPVAAVDKGVGRDSGSSEPRPIPPGAYSALSVCALSFAWFGVLVGMFIASNVAPPTASASELLQLSLARIQLFTRIEVGIAIAAGIGQLYARAGRLAWIIYGCVLAALLAEVGWLQPTLTADLAGLQSGRAAEAPVAYAIHLWLDVGRAVGVFAAGMLGFRLTAERTAGR